MTPPLLTPEQREDLKRLEQALPEGGEWQATDGVVWHEVEGKHPACCNKPLWDGDPSNDPECCGSPDFPPEQEKIADTSPDYAVFIAAARNALPALLATLEAVEQERDAANASTILDYWDTSGLPSVGRFDHTVDVANANYRRAEAAEQRIAALEAHVRELRQWMHPRDISSASLALVPDLPTGGERG